MQTYYNDIDQNPSIYLAKLEQTPQIIGQLIEGLDTSILTHRPDGQWSIQEHIGHLLCIESLWIGRLDDFVLQRETARPWNGTNADTDAARFNDQKIRAILRDFADIRSIHLGMLTQPDIFQSKHILFHEGDQKQYRMIDHLYMMADHDEAHIQIIKNRIH